MPYVNVQLFEERLTPEAETRLLTELTDAVARALGEQYTASTWVVLQGTPARRWAVGGTVNPLGDQAD